MASVVRNLIEYAGIADHLPLNALAFKQLNVEETLCLPCQKPNIEQIAKATGEISIKSTRVIKTPKATSLEGQKLTGWKLVIEGELKQKVEYVADEPEQPVHSAHFNGPFSTFIVLPENFRIGIPITVTGYIEDIFVQKLDKRCLFKNVKIGRAHV